MRVAVVDIGTNSTRLLVCDVAGTAIAELERVSIVTRLGQGVDATGRLADIAIGRVTAVLDDYVERIERHGAERRIAILTSAVRDAANGGEFTAMVRERYGLDARTLAGEQEASLSFLGASSDRDLGASPGPVLVIDIGGGSTELITGDGSGMRFHVSTQAGVVRMTERHVAHDPPDPDELQAVAADVRGVLDAAVPAGERDGVAAGIAVAGTATSLAAIDLELEPYDGSRVHGHVLERGTVELLLARLAGMTLDERREVRGLHPDRAATIVAGAVLLLEVMRCFDLDRVEVSEHDILRGAALSASAGEF